MAKQIAEMTVEKAVMELPGTKTLRLKWPEGYEQEFKTGQFITLYWPDTPAYKRAYSLSSCALDRGAYEVTVKRDGKMGTRIVDWAKEGDKLWVIPPARAVPFPCTRPNKHLICIVERVRGSLRSGDSFAKPPTRRALGTRITILYSVRTHQRHHFPHGIPRYRSIRIRISFLVTCTRLRNDDPWTRTTR